MYKEFYFILNRYRVGPDRRYIHFNILPRYITVCSNVTCHMQQLTNEDPHELSTSDNIYYP